MDWRATSFQCRLLPLLSPQLSFASFGGTFKTKATREKWTLAVLFSVLFSGDPLLHVFVLKLRILIFIIFSECVWSSRFTPGLAQYSCQLICLLQSLSPATFLHKVTYTLHSLKGTPYTSALWALKRSKHSFASLFERISSLQHTFRLLHQQTAHIFPIGTFGRVTTKDLSTHYCCSLLHGTNLFLFIFPLSTF